MVLLDRKSVFRGGKKHPKTHTFDRFPTFFPFLFPTSSFSYIIITSFGDQDGIRTHTGKPQWINMKLALNDVIMPLPSLGAVYNTSVVVEGWKGRDRLSVIGVAPRGSMHEWLSLATGYRYSYCPYVVRSGNPSALSKYGQSMGTTKVCTAVLS